ncbi:MAG TPA: oligosaccharide flippase family protein [Chitinophagaceae bacterium]|nr:oligosaccharide flippase family protein [Chitinophagaceae bacterium]
MFKPVQEIREVLKAVTQKKLFKNALYSSGSFFMISLINFVTLPLFVSKLGVVQFGIFTLVTSLFGYYGIFDLGMGQGLIKFVSERTDQERKAEIVPGILSAFWVQVMVGLVLSSILFFSSASISRVLHVGEANIQVTSMLIRIAAVGFFFTMISAVFSSALMGMQQYHITSRADALNILLLNAVSLIVLYTAPGSGLKELLIINCISAALLALFYMIVAVRKIPRLRLRWHMDLDLLRQFFRFSVHIFLSKISNVFATYIVRFIIGFFAGPAAVTYYTVPSKLIGALGGMLSSAASTLMPYVSALNTDLSQGRIAQTLIRVSTGFTAFTIPVSLFIAVFSRQILTVWMGSEFAGQSWVILSLLSISSLVGSFSTIPNQVVLGIGNSRLLGYFSIMAVLCYSILLPLLGKLFLLTGVAVGLLITSLFLIVIVLTKTTKFLEVPLSFYVNEVFAPHVWLAIVFTSLSCIIVNIEVLPVAWKLLGGICLMILYYTFLYFDRGKQILTPSTS